MYFEKSSTTATLQHCPARLVPPPRARIGRTELPAERDGGEHVVRIPRHDHADGNLAVVGSVAGIQRPAAGVETDFAVNRPFEPLRQPAGFPVRKSDLVDVTPGLGFVDGSRGCFAD